MIALPPLYSTHKKIMMMHKVAKLQANHSCENILYTENYINYGVLVYKIVNSSNYRN